MKIVLTGRFKSEVTNCELLFLVFLFETPTNPTLAPSPKWLSLPASQALGVGPPLEEGGSQVCL